MPTGFSILTDESVVDLRLARLGPHAAAQPFSIATAVTLTARRGFGCSGGKAHNSACGRCVRWCDDTVRSSCLVCLNSVETHVAISQHESETRGIFIYGVDSYPIIRIVVNIINSELIGIIAEIQLQNILGTYI